VSQREVLIVLAHAMNCMNCRDRLLREPSAVLRGRALTEEEREILSNLSDQDFQTAELLARGTGTTADNVRSYVDHAVVRLRHFQ
jgi:hypothetical protein